MILPQERAMSIQRFPPEFKEEAVRQIVDRGYSIAEISLRTITGIGPFCGVFQQVLKSLLKNSDLRIAP